MVQRLTFAFNDTSILAAGAGIDVDFLNKINQTVIDIRQLRASHPKVNRVAARLTSPDGEVFEITVN
jgi:hypothetical protein